MYSISEDMLRVLNSPVHSHAIRGTCSGVPFSGSRHIVRDSFRINNQICSSTEVEVGGAYIGQLNLTFTREFATTRGGWQGREITLEIGTKVEGEWVFIPAPGGSYTIQDATWTASGLEVVAYDHMAKFDKSLSLQNSAGQPYSFLTYACTACGVELGMTEEEVEALPNGQEPLGLYPTDSLKTWRDLIGFMAQTLGCFATMDRAGKLVFVPFSGGESVLDVEVNRRYMGASFSDFETYYTGISVVNMETNETNYYGVEPDDGLTMNLGSNPFLQYGTAATVEIMRRRILTEVNGFNYAPYSASMLLNPAIDLGDVLTFVGGFAQGCEGMVMSYTMDLDTLSVSGFGENPALSNALSKNDKELSGIAGANAKNVLSYYTYTNVDDLEVLEDPETIVSLRFVTTEKTNVMLWTEIDGDVVLEDEKATITFTYYLNGEELPYHPTHTIGEDGKHIIPLQYYLLDVDANTINEWRIDAQIEGGSLGIEQGDLHFVLSGQGLAAEEASAGIVQVDDNIALTHRFRHVVDLSDDLVGISTQAPTEATAGDSMTIRARGKFLINLSDSLEIISRINVFDRITEEGGARLTEEGGARLTEGGND